VSVTKVPAQLEAALVREALLKKQVAELQAENAKLQAGVAMWRANARAEAEVCLKLGAENAKLEAIVYAAKAVMRSYKHKNAGWSVSGIYAELEQAIKEVK